MSVLVTGGSGFTGGYVIPRLVAAGHDVVALARSDPAAARVEALGAKPIYGDLDDATSIDDAFSASGADALVNLASLGFGHAPLIIAAAEDAGIRRAVFVSTTAIFTTLNAPSKAVRIAAEDAIRESGLDWTILRPTMIYGAPGDRNMWRLLQFLRRSPIVPLPDGGRRLQQPVHVDDLAAAIVTALDQPAANGRSYDLAGPTPLTFREVVEQAAAAVERQPRLVSLPARPAIVLLHTLERTGLGGPIKAEQISRLLEDKAFDISDAQRDLAFVSRPFDQGIREEARASALNAKESLRAFWEAEACGERYADAQDRVRYELEPGIAPFARFDDAANLRVLEIGVGMGADFMRWIRAGATATGVDLTERSVAITKERIEREGHAADVRVADAEQLPFDDGSFDVVYSWGVLHHTPDTAQAVKEAVRVLAPGGRLALMLYHRHAWVALAAWARFGLLRGRPLLSLSEAVTSIESPGTKAFTSAEAVAMLGDLDDVKAHPVATHWDRRVAGPLVRVLGDRFGWFLLVEGRKPE